MPWLSWKPLAAASELGRHALGFATGAVPGRRLMLLQA